MILILYYLGVSSQSSGVRSQPTPRPSPSQEGKKEEERVVEGESFLFALLSGQDIIPLFTNADF